MGRVNYLQTNFTAGEITPRLDGRVDISKYKNGVKTLENFLLLTHGGVTKRPGSMFVAEVADSSKAVRLQEFEFSTTQAYVLEFGDLTIRFYANNGRVESGGSPVEVVTPYTEDELPDLRFTQSADVLYISHADHPIKKLSRTSSTAFTLTDADIVGGPFQPINGDDTLILYIAIDSTTTAVTGATQADPCVIAAVGHGYQSGECVTFASVGGMSDLNGNRYFIIKLTDDTFSLRDESYRDIDSTAYGAYTSGGTVNRSITKWGTYSDGSTGHTLSSDFEIFTSEHVGALVRLWEPGQATGISGEPV
ncbi:MAG: hypothetical protein GY938_13305, partial [Ketobacter sp.]|nr:hypothetical protein [Ketobacter sp.]